MPLPQFEPMTVGQILDRAFLLYRSHFVRFVAITAIVQVPVGLLSIAGSQVVVQTFRAGRSSGGVPVDPELILAGSLGLVMFRVLLLLLGQSLCSAALIKSVSECYLGGEATVVQAYRFILPRFLRILLAAFLVGLIVWVGLLLCIVPGIIFSLWLAVVIPAIVVEDCRATDGLSRSWALTRGNILKVFLVNLTVFLVAAITGGIFQYGAMALSYWAFDPASPARLMVTQLGETVGQILAMPIGATAAILLYYDLRIRKEGFDLEMLARRLEPAPAAGSPGSPLGGQGREGALTDAIPPIH